MYNFINLTIYLMSYVIIRIAKLKLILIPLQIKYSFYKPMNGKIIY